MPRAGLVEQAVRPERAVQRRDGDRRLAAPEQIVQGPREPADHAPPPIG